MLLVATLALPTFALAEEQSFAIDGGQVSVPVGLTVQVKAVTIGKDATQGAPAGKFRQPQLFLLIVAISDN